MVFVGWSLIVYSLWMKLGCSPTSIDSSIRVKRSEYLPRSAQTVLCKSKVSMLVACILNQDALYVHRMRYLAGTFEATRPNWSGICCKQRPEGIVGNLDIVLLIRIPWNLCNALLDGFFWPSSSALKRIAGKPCVKLSPSIPVVEICRICCLYMELRNRFISKWPQRNKVIKLKFVPSMMAKNALVRKADNGEEFYGSICRNVWTWTCVCFFPVHVVLTDFGGCWGIYVQECLRSIWLGHSWAHACFLWRTETMLVPCIWSSDAIYIHGQCCRQDHLDTVSTFCRTQMNLASSHSDTIMIFFPKTWM